MPKAYFSHPAGRCKIESYMETEMKTQENGSHRKPKGTGKQKAPDTRRTQSDEEMEAGFSEYDSGRLHGAAGGLRDACSGTGARA